MKQVFRAWGTFAAVRAAETWCKENGFSVGMMQGPERRGIMRGTVSIAKWRNLGEAEIKSLNGVMSGDMREGPITVEIYDATPTSPQPTPAAPKKTALRPRAAKKAPTRKKK